MCGLMESTLEGVLPKSIAQENVCFRHSHALRENQNASYAILGRRILGILNMRGLGDTPSRLDIAIGRFKRLKSKALKDKTWLEKKQKYERLISSVES